MAEGRSPCDGKELLDRGGGGIGGNGDVGKFEEGEGGGGEGRGDVGCGGGDVEIGVVDEELGEVGHGGCGWDVGVGGVEELFVVEDGGAGTDEAEEAEAGETGGVAVDHDTVEGEAAEGGGIEGKRAEEAEGIGGTGGVLLEGEGFEGGEIGFLEGLVEDDAHGEVGAFYFESTDAGDGVADDFEGLLEVSEAGSVPELDAIVREDDVEGDGAQFRSGEKVSENIGIAGMADVENGPLGGKIVDDGAPARANVGDENGEGIRWQVALEYQTQDLICETVDVAHSRL